MYPTVVIAQVVILFHIASLMAQWLWRRSLDPDNFSIPYLTALSDRLLGSELQADSDGQSYRELEFEPNVLLAAV